MEESSYRRWDTWIKIAGLIGFIAGGVVGIGEYVYTTSAQMALETNKFAAEQHKLLL
jgi:hypothetical protein